MILSSTGTGADAVQVTASAGGMDITSAKVMDITTSNFKNKPTSILQELDLRHHLHPFTDHKELKIKKHKVVVRAIGVFIFDNQINNTPKDNYKVNNPA